MEQILSAVIPLLTEVFSYLCRFKNHHKKQTIYVRQFE